MREKFLVTSREDMERRGWDQLDFVYINGDAYVDHPGFAAALIGRVLESRGYRVVSFPSPTGIVPNRSRNWDGRGWPL